MTTVWRTILLALVLLGTARVATRAATITQQLSPSQVVVGSPAVITLVVRDGDVSSPKSSSSSVFGVTLPTVDVALPQVEGIQSAQTGMSISVGNGAATTTIRFTLIARHAGTFAIPDFDVRTRSGESLHVKAMTLQVAASPDGLANGGLNSLAPTPNPATAFNPAGPVVIPPQNPAPVASPSTPADGAPPEPKAPRDADGGPAKVFIIITPQTTNAYVGQAVPMEIDFYIRMSVNSDQNSLPTIKGSNFLMNSFSTRGRVTIGLLENEQYLRETWVTSIAAPKSGDFPLSMQRDTYWVKSLAAADTSIFGNFFNRRANLAHEMIDSNLLTMHIMPLPEEGRPEHFTGAIGQFQVTGDAAPASVAVGEPVRLHFTVSGEGNFDYVRSPALTSDPAWKTYVPTSKTNFVDESHAHAMKSFDQSAIPQKGGVLPLPEASFSYFDPVAKSFVTVPIKLPDIVVTGSATTAATTTTAGDSGSAEAFATPEAMGLLPNRVEIGSPSFDVTPAFRHAWFWGVQALLLALPVAGAIVALLQWRSARARAARTAVALRTNSLRQEQDAMTEAVRQGDARAFFLAARHAVQLQLGARWNVAPEALTLREIALRDPQLAESLEPLFRQADEVIYSGRASAAIDLAPWEKRVRTELLQPQPV